jgi:hypothetical protein
MHAATSASPRAGLKTGWTIELDQSSLRLEPQAAAQPDPWGARGGPVFDVVAYSSLSLRIPLTGTGTRNGAIRCGTAMRRRPGGFSGSRPLS